MQAKDQLQSAHHGRAVSIAVRFIIGTSLFTCAAAASAAEPTTQFEAKAEVAPVAQIEAGAIAITAPSEPGHFKFDKGTVRVETSAEGAGEAVATFLQPPAIGHAQLEAAFGVVQFALAPFAAGYGAITSGQRKLTAEELFAAERHVTDTMRELTEQNQLREFVLQYAPEQTHRLFIDLPAEGKRAADPFSGTLETRVESLQLVPIHEHNDHYRLTIRARARLVKAANDQVISERAYEYTSGVGLFIDWARLGGLESVAQTGFRQIAQDISRDFCSPVPEAPLFLGAGYGSPNPAAPAARPVRLAKRSEPGTPMVRFVDYRLTANSPLEVLPSAERAQVMIRAPKVKEPESSDLQTDTEWAMDDLENHRNIVVQAGACLAAVPMGIWEQTVGAIGRKSHEGLSEAGGMVQRVVWKTPLQQNLADDIARKLAPQTAQPVMLRKLPSPSGEGSPTGDLVRISSGGDLAIDGHSIQMRPDTALKVEVSKVELCIDHGSKRPSLALEAKVTLSRTRDGQELFTWPVRYCSAGQRVGEWTAHDGAQVELELRHCSREIAEAVVAQLLREGCVAPGSVGSSAIAQN